MKTFIFAAALVLGTAAIAQGTTQPAPQPTEQPSGETVDDPSQSTGPEGQTQQGTDHDGDAMATPGTNQAPMAPMSPPPMAPAMAPPPPMATAPGMMSNMPAPMAAPAGYPACSRTVTDRCTQTYERGRARRR